MNSNPNNLVMRNLTIFKSNNFKAMIIGILLIATLMFSNTYGTAFAQAGKNVIGCANIVKATISKLPNQTADASTKVPLYNIEPGEDRGDTSIIIPGIGIGVVSVNFHLDSIGEYVAEVSSIPGQTHPSDSGSMTADEVCSSNSPVTKGINIPGIGSGSLEVTKVN